ncbi:MAG: hypothetical protein V3U98_10310 [Acidobacteriota bacterium]
MAKSRITYGCEAAGYVIEIPARAGGGARRRGACPGAGRVAVKRPDQGRVEEV